MVTLYCIRVRLHVSGVEKTIRCTTATERALVGIALSENVDIVREFEIDSSATLREGVSEA